MNIAIEPREGWAVRDSEGRTYGYYPTEEQARAAASSANAGYPWRTIRAEPTR